MPSRVPSLPGPALPDPSERSAALVRATYESIKAAILGNRLRPGTKLGHQLLAEQFGVSRTPVRESLERLAQEGYVRHVANRGYFVAEIGADEVRDLYGTREALELHALTRLMRQGLEAGTRRRLDAINERYRVMCLENLSRERLLVDRDFHVALAGAAGNVHLAATLTQLFDRLIMKRRVEGYHDTRGLAPYEDHVRLIEAIGRGDGPTADAVLREHIQSACSRFLRYLGAGDHTDTPAAPLPTAAAHANRS